MLKVMVRGGVKLQQDKIPASPPALGKVVFIFKPVSQILKDKSAVSETDVAHQEEIGFFPPEYSQMSHG